jgi:hypothetical protein
LNRYVIGEGRQRADGRGQKEIIREKKLRLLILIKKI